MMHSVGYFVAKSASTLFRLWEPRCPVIKYIIPNNILSMVIPALVYNSVYSSQKIIFAAKFLEKINERNALIAQINTEMMSDILGNAAGWMLGTGSQVVTELVTPAGQEADNNAWMCATACGVAAFLVSLVALNLFAYLLCGSKRLKENEQAMMATGLGILSAVECVGMASSVVNSSINFLGSSAINALADPAGLTSPVTSTALISTASTNNLVMNAVSSTLMQSQVQESATEVLVAAPPIPVVALEKEKDSPNESLAPSSTSNEAKKAKPPYDKNKAFQKFLASSSPGRCCWFSG